VVETVGNTGAWALFSAFSARTVCGQKMQKKRAQRNLKR
jgi:hypothetical protein